MMRAFMAALFASASATPAAAVAAPAEIAGPAQIAAEAPPAPDYADPANWSAGPGGSGPASAVPRGASPAVAAAEAGADVFFVHPTTDRSPVLWNADVRDAAANRWVDESSIARQASVFNGCCRVFAPRYRAATYKSLMSSAHRDAAYALAYADIERAFDWFLANASHGRPFIIAGHSQGAKHIADLLERRIDRTPLRRRMVAAYIIGINIAEGDFGKRFRHTPPCDTPKQTGCAVQWNALAPDANLPAIVASYEKSFTDLHGEGPGQRMLCINPVTFDRKRPFAATAEARGAVPGDPGFGPMQPVRPQAVSVRCESGMAVSTALPGLELKTLPGGVLHYEDIALFYGDVRANAIARVQAWQTARARKR